MSNILIIGNILKDVYLRLDEQKNQFEVDEKGTPWLDLSFDGKKCQFFRRKAIYGGAAVALEVLNKFEISARIAGAKLGIVDGEMVENGQIASAYRYMLCYGNKIAYVVPETREETKWVAPEEAIDWILVDRSAGVTEELLKEIETYLSMSTDTRLAYFAPKNRTDQDRKMLKLAHLVFADEKLDEKISAPVCMISDQKITMGKINQTWRIERTDLMTHLTLYSIIAASVFSCLVRGMTVKEALYMAKLNAENSSLSGSLPLARLTDLMADHKAEEADIKLLAATLMTEGKGILAADESGGNIHAKFEALGIEDTERNRRDYRNLLLSTPELEKYISGVILFDETTKQKADDGRTFVDYLTAHGVVPGVKVDLGLENFPNSAEKYTKGLEGLAERLHDYYEAGLRFCKWRAAFEIDLGTPSEMAMEKNAADLATYAKLCQDNGLVPIVEPEVVYDGNYTIAQCAEITGKVLDTAFDALAAQKVDNKACILKVNMVLAGKKYPIASTPVEVGEATAEVLKAHVPEDLAGVVFLSGGQQVEQATENLRAVIARGPFPWPVTFSFSRALQTPALEAWAGDNANKVKTQDAFLARLIANTAAIAK